MRRTCLSLVLATGCAYITDEDESWRLDPDGDGVLIGQDCDDASASVGAAVSFYADSDEDGYGDPAVAEEACTRPEGFVANADDCDDTNAGAFPGNAEVWYDGVDGDCAGDDDFDQDGDGYSIDTDCDDTDPERFPDPEVDEIYFNGEDDNCDASDGDGDQDGDGFWAADYVNRCNGSSVIPLEIPAGKEGDCWDDPSFTPEAYETRDGFEDLAAHEVNPDALETWYDGADQDCDGASDFDRDGDGYDSEAELAGGTDCDDGSAGVNPGAAEVEGDGVDNDCSGDANGNGIEGAASVTTADGVRYGIDTGQRTGYALAGAGDVNADGASDFLIGARYDSTLASQGGAAYLSTGPATGEAAVTAGPALLGDQSSGQFGTALASVGDQNADGFDDFAVSGYAESARGTRDGSVSVFLGPLSVSGPASALRDAWYYGPSTDAYAGTSLASGDLNNDGLVDLVVGGALDGPGTVWVEYGPATSGGRLGINGEITTEGAGGSVGSSLAAADLTGDGITDLAVGASTTSPAGAELAGAAYVLEGPVDPSTTVDGSTTVLEVSGAGTNHLLGQALSAGDVTGDGYSDLLVGAPGAGTSSASAGGAVYLFAGPVSGAGDAVLVSDASVYGDSGSAAFGFALDAGGDTNGDGTADLVVGAPQQSNRAFLAGSSWVFQGPLSGTTTTASSTGAERHSSLDYDYLGAAVSIPGDVDADGYDDVLVGAWGDDRGGPAGGAAYLFLGGAL